MSRPTPAYVTTYFPEDIVRTAVTGCCHDVALAIHRRMGWPVACLWRDPVLDAYTLFPHPVPMHLMALAPDGRAVDVEGVHDLDALRARYAGHEAVTQFRVETYPDEAAWAQATETAAAGGIPELAPREHGIAAADQVLAGSPAFLALLQQLAAGRGPRTRPAARGR